jgi:hypothetical protein
MLIYIYITLILILLYSDYNGDKFVDWDEFTSFIIQNSLVESNTSKQILFSSFQKNDAVDPLQSATQHTENSSNLDEYTVEYSEDITLRDHILSNFKQNTLMKFVPDNRRILLIPQEQDHIMIIDESFKLHANLCPNKIQTQGSAISANVTFDDNKPEPAPEISLTSQALGSTQRLTMEKFCIYDIIYLSGRDLYAFTSSDHTIVICKEHTSVGGNATTYFYHDKIYHRSLHHKLCWSPKHNILCSITTDNVIHGWNIDKGIQIFQVSRHNDMIMDFICVDDFDSFITCSMDGKIIMWSTTTRRVRGIFNGHRRGVRCLSHYKSTLLSSGFECDARTWDLSSKDPVAILKGHRSPIRTSKLMCDHATCEKDYRAITVDESGEFRLWNIYIKDRAADPVPAETLQIFFMSHAESPVNQIRFIAMAYNQSLSKGHYSDFIACSSKLLRFVPEKHAKEFHPPSHCVFNEATATLLTCAGRSIHKYDLSKGKFISSFHNIYESELSFMLLDGIQGRRIFIACSNGDLLLINSVSGSIIDKCLIHAKEITSIAANIDSFKEGQTKVVYTSSLDGRIRCIEEFGGKLHVHNTIENAFGDDIGITMLKVVKSANVLIATSSTAAWGIWNESTLKKVMVIHEEFIIMSMEVIGVSSQLSTESHQYSHNFDTRPDGSSNSREHILTVAIALPQYIQIYCIDFQEVRGVATKRLFYSSSISASISFAEEDETIYITDMKLVYFSANESVNNSSQLTMDKRLTGTQLVVGTDDGKSIFWNITKLQEESEAIFRTMDQKRLHRPAQRRLVLEHNSNMMPWSNALSSAPVTPTTALNASHNVLEKLSKKETRRKRIQEDLASQRQRQAMKNGASLHDQESEDSDLLEADTEVQEGNTLVIDTEGDPASKSLEEQNLTKLFSPNSLKGIFSPMHSSSRNRLGNVELGGEYDSSIFVIRRKFQLPDMSPDLSFKTHADSITAIVALSEHACTITVSLDGYHRIWNADQHCLGELLLPNVTEHMKKKRHKLASLLKGNRTYLSNPASNIIGDTEWRFIMERLPITAVHQKQAKMLVESITKHTNAQHSLTIRHKKHHHIQKPPSSKSSRLIQSVAAAIAHDSLQRKVSTEEKPVILPLSPIKSAQHLIQQHALMKSPSILKSTHNLSNEKDSSYFNFPLQTGFPDDDTVVEEMNKSTRNNALKALASPLYVEQRTTVSAAMSLADAVALKDNQNDNAVRMSAGTPSCSPSRLASRASTRESHYSNGSPQRLISSPIRTQKSTASEPFTPVEEMPSRVRPFHKKLHPHSPTHDVVEAAVIRKLSQTSSFPEYAKESAKRRERALPSISIPGSEILTKKRDSTFSIGSLSVSSASVSRLGSPLKPDGSLTTASLWSTPDIAYDGRAHIPAAFSDYSINSCLKDGIIDGEAYHILRRIGARADKVAVYEKTQPVILLRNPALSVNFEMPSNLMSNCGEAEFGSQKVSYPASYR